MKTDLSCFPCFLRQCLIALDAAEADPAARETVLREAAALISSVDLERPPAAAATDLHRLVRERLGRDPFAGLKEHSNTRALELLPRLRDRATNGGDPLETGVRGALAGNMMDFGLFSEIHPERELESAFRRPLEGAGMDGFRGLLERSEEILYLFDNAGEIVFDAFLIEQLIRRGHRVTGIVKGGSVINDATRNDADNISLGSVCPVENNGSDGVGTILSSTSERFQELFRTVDLIISKGQANYETLVGEPRTRGRRIVFLFQVKCDVVGGSVGYPRGSQLVLGSHGVGGS